MSKYRTRASFGKRQEYAAIAELLRRGFDLYQTLVDDQGIDCVVRRVVNGKPVYTDLQIKARSRDCKSCDAARFAALDIKEPRENLLFMFYSEQLCSYWIVPSLELVELASRNKAGRNIGKYHILFSGMQQGRATVNQRFDEYKDDKGFKKLEDTFETLGAS